MSHRHWKFRVQDILDAVQKIISYTEGLSFDCFANDSKTMDAVIRQFTIIGEAASRVPEEITSTASTIPWSEIRGIRNVVVHEYLDWTFERPIFKGSDFIRSGTIPKPTAQRILNVLKNEGILRELEPGSGSRSAILAYPQLLNMAEGYEAF